MAIKERKIVKLIKSWFNFNQPNDNILVQKVENGYFVKVYAGFKLVVQHSDGLISIHEPGLVFVPPLATGSIISDHNLTREFEYRDNKKTKDDVTVEAHEKISYEYSVLPDNASAIKVLSEPTADAVIQRYVQDIVTLIVTNSELNKIKHGFDISATSFPNWLDLGTSQRLNDIFNAIEQYGCELKTIHICDFNEPKAIIDAETARKAQEIQIEAEKERAKGDRKIELIRARTDYLVSMYHYQSIHKIAEKNNLSSREIFELIRADILKNSNVVNVMGAGNVDPMASAVYQRYCQQFSNDKGNVTNEPIDTSFEEAGPSFSK